MMRHILILRELSKKENLYVSRLIKNNEYNIIADPELDVPFENIVPYIKLSAEEKKTINYQVLTELLEFGDTIINGQAISKIINLNGADLWYYQKFRIYFELVNRQFEIEELKKNLKRVTSVIIFAAKKSSNYYNLGINAVSIFPSKKSGEPNISITSLLGYGFVAFYRLTKSIFSPMSGFRNKRIVCIDTIDHYRKILNLDGSTMIFENAFLGYLYQTRGDQIGFIDQLLIPKFKKENRFRFDKKYLINHNDRTRVLGERIMVSSMLSISVVKSFISSKKLLRQKLNILKKAFLLQPKKLSILNSFISLNNTTLFYLLKYYAYDNFFQNSRVESLLTIDENSANFKIILDAAKKHSIFTIGYQHGSIHRLHPAYMYTKADIMQNPVPDITITWGEKWSKLLIENGNYKRESVKLAGQIRTDVISGIVSNNLINKENVLPEVCQHKIILFATQPQRDQTLRYKAAEDVVRACKDVCSAHLIFKLHPREKDPDFYRGIAIKYGLKNYSVSMSKDLYVLLKISDLVITCFSTVGTEALYFRKPLIILDHLKQDILNYHKDCVAYQATNVEELIILIQGVLSRKVSIDSDILDEYILSSTYKIDGCVSERVWDIIHANSD